jgi:hypothetical protein
MLDIAGGIWDSMHRVREFDSEMHGIVGGDDVDDTEDSYAYGYHKIS